MRITIKVKPGSKENYVEKIGENSYILRVKARAQEGKANDAVIKLLSGYFDIAKSRIAIHSGAGCRNKIVDIV